ncbi:MAG: iron ABC transporter substrate-binding protein [Desulfobacterales bacterium]|nr:iron ABC transporter substrate-binding protein [Desulfobacterales bacterium]
MKHLTFALLLILFTVLPAGADTIVVDALGRSHTFNTPITRIICSGAGCLRLAVLLEAQDHVVAVDNMERRKGLFDARPYALANPQLKSLPLFGQFRGRDNPEQILGLSPQPQVIFKTYPAMGHDPIKLEKKTGIPVVSLRFGDLDNQRRDFFQSLETMGRVLGREERAQALKTFITQELEELDRRTRDIPAPRRKSCFVGGIAFRGPHGFASTEPGYPPFQFIHGKNIARTDKAGPQLRHTIFSKEALLTADPQILFLDLSTLQMGQGRGGLHELKTDAVFQALTAVQSGRIYGVLPYNWYSQNPSSILADAWFIGKILYPERFRDIHPEKKADEIYRFLVGRPLFKTMDSAFGGMAFKALDLGEE